MTTIAHRFVSAIADDGDPTMLGPNEWNDGHDLSFAASQRAAGRNTAGAGLAEEVTASQIFDWVSNTNGALLTRAAGAWGAASRVTVDNGALVLADDTAPVAPSTGVKLHSMPLAGRSMPAMIGPLGAMHALQPHIGRAKVGRWSFTGSNIAPSADGMAGVAAASGTLTTRVPANTNLCTSLRRSGYVSGALAGNAAQASSNTTNPKQFWRGNAAGLGGFTFVFRFNVSDAALVNTANMFVGIDTGATIADVGPETLANLIGVGCTSGDTQLQLYAADATPRSRTPLGANFPVNTTNVDVYELILYAPPNGSSVQYAVNRLNTGDVASGTISSVNNMPLSTVFLRPVFFRSNGGTAAAVGIDPISMYVETDN